MRGLISLALLCIVTSLQAQIIENPPYNMITELPQGELRGFGIGSLGFDGLMNTYNPHFQGLDGAGYRVFAGGNIGVTGQRITSDVRDNFSTPFTPTLGLQYVAGRTLLQLCYYQDYSLREHMTGSGTYWLGESPLQFSEKDVRIRQSTLQATVSLNIIPSLSFTAGLLSRSFRYEWDIKTIPPVVHETGLLRRFQLLAGITANPFEGLETYATFVSQRPRVNLTPGKIVQPYEAYDYPVLIQASYYGNIGYGVQVEPLSKFKVSVEMRHQFLEDSTGFLYVHEYVFDKARHIWNNEITLGTSLQVSDNVRVGLRYSRFLKYDTLERMPQSASDGFYGSAGIAHPYSLGIESLATIGDFNIEAAYQYSKSAYEQDGQTVISDAVHSASLLVGYSFSFEK